jgi:hypothetical protein
MYPLCQWTHFAGQSATALQSNLKIRAGQIERIDKKDGEKNWDWTKFEKLNTIFQQINIQICKAAYFLPILLLRK